MVSRLVWMMNRGAIPARRVVRHFVCNNSKCINVDHFLLGTRKQNNHDKIKDGTLPLGGQLWNAKITADMARRARADGVDLRALSAELGVRYHTLYQARVGISWKHIIDPPPVTIPLRPVGMAVRSAKLTETSVREIRGSTESISELSRLYGVSRPAIRAIKNRESWKTVADVH